MFDKNSLDSGVSPVVGVILMVAVTVILAAVIGSFVTGLNDSTQENPQAGVSISDNGDGTVDVQAISIDRADEIRVLVDGTQKATISDAGGTSTVPSGQITIVGALDGKTTVLQTSDRTTAGTSGGTTDGTSGGTTDGTSGGTTDGTSGGTTENVSGTIRINPVIQGATVTAFGPGENQLDTTTTDSEGKYTLEASNFTDAEIVVNVEDFDSSATTNPLYTSASLPADTSSNVSMDFDQTKTIDTTVDGQAVSVIHRGAGTDADPHTIGNVHQLQAIDHSSDTRGDSYELVTDIDASATTNWNGGDGFKPIGDSDNLFKGNLDGNNHAVDSLVIDRPNNKHTGLIGLMNGGTVKNVAVTNADINGDDDVGGLVGQNDGGTVSNSFVTGKVSGNQEVGGLVGRNIGPVSNSFVTAKVSGPDDSVGGLVANSYVSGDESDSYWDTQATNQSTSGDGSTATGLTTSEMQGSAAESNMTGFDFDNVWQTVEGDYPELRE